MRAPQLLSVLLLAASSMVACGGSSGEPPGASADAGADGDHVVDSIAIDGSDDTSAADAGADADAAPGCPLGPPKDGDACTEARECSYPDFDCGGATIAKCSGSTWRVTPPPACPSQHCPEIMPEPGSSIACTVPHQICRYWPSFDAAASCAEKKCEGGIWVDAGTSCTAPRSSCGPPDACTSPFGCITGKCSPMCICDLTGHLRCTAHPC